jgi:ribosomal protein S18 acetylase RimI-like enzyme
MGEADHLIHDRMLAAITPTAVFATIEPTAAPGRPHAFALAVADEGMVGIFDVLVDARMRRRGLGRKLVQALMAWGKTQDAHSAYLQVGGHNNEAISLYQQLGFRTVYPYHYRRKALPTSA